MLAALSAFHPGAEWKDTDGKSIQAHGGSVIVADGKYYFYGENNEKTDDIKDGPAKEAADRFWADSKTRPTATCKARYVWLPVKFDGDRPYLEWCDSWSLDDFADEK